MCTTGPESADQPPRTGRLSVPRSLGLSGFHHNNFSFFRPRKIKLTTLNRRAMGDPSRRALRLLEVTRAEFASLPPGRSVYEKQGDVFFLTRNRGDLVARIDAKIRALKVSKTPSAARDKGGDAKVDPKARPPLRS